MQKRHTNHRSHRVLSLLLPGTTGRSGRTAVEVAVEVAVAVAFGVPDPPTRY